MYMCLFYALLMSFKHNISISIYYCKQYAYWYTCTHMNIHVKCCVTTMYNYKHNINVQYKLKYSLKNQKVLRILKALFKHLPSLVRIFTLSFEINYTNFSIEGFCQ